jgi:excisionase family DNA binding protein
LNIGLLLDGTNCATPRRMPRTFMIEDAAVLLGISRRTVYYRIREGKLRTVRTLGGSQRVLLESIEVLLAEQERARDPDAGASSTGPSERSPAL